MLRRKNLLRNNLYLLKVFKGFGDVKVVEEEYGDELLRKYFVYYDCRSMIVDYEEFVFLYV